MRWSRRNLEMLEVLYSLLKTIVKISECVTRYCAGVLVWCLAQEGAAGSRRPTGRAKG